MLAFIILASMSSYAKAIPMEHSGSTLAEKVRKAIRQDEELSGYPITVRVQHQTLFLRGHVRSDWLLFKANALAKNAGAEKIINQINITD